MFGFQVLYIQMVSVVYDNLVTVHADNLNKMDYILVHY